MTHILPQIELPKEKYNEALEYFEKNRIAEVAKRRTSRVTRFKGDTATLLPVMTEKQSRFFEKRTRKTNMPSRPFTTRT